MGVKSDTTMVKDVAKSFGKFYDKDSLSIVFPEILEYLKGKDANFEMISSNTMQQIRLIYSYNVTTRTLATIFIHTDCKDIKYRKAAEIGDEAYKLLKDDLKFQEVRTFTNLTKE